MFLSPHYVSVRFDYSSYFLVQTEQTTPPELNLFPNIIKIHTKWSRTLSSNVHNAVRCQTILVHLSGHMSRSSGINQATFIQVGHMSWRWYLKTNLQYKMCIIVFYIAHRENVMETLTWRYFTKLHGTSKSKSSIALPAETKYICPSFMWRDMR